MKKLLINTLICICVGAVFVFLIIWARGVFKAETNLDIIRIMCDGFFGTGIILTCAGVLVFCSNGGTFDMIAFGTKRFFGAIFSSRKAVEQREKKTFAEYREEHSSNKKDLLHLLISGGLFLIIAIVFLIIFLYLDIS